ncbi:hypothetical protein QP519_10715 [Weeksella virosa]|uniref:hypothetical protein n=1 Tax=Weeksella virosa TaxID=1014 RepID=UPI002554840A|nr:hypothetical protein [Weeksella virosa]MDK7376006.1 hypothetical protein [Weeksella virosa]
MAKENTKETEGVQSPSVDNNQATLIDSLNKEIKDLKAALKKEQEYSKELEETYSDQIEENEKSEFNYIPLVNFIDGERVTRDQVVADKNLLKLFKK